jgi:hypothetical protein
VVLQDHLVQVALQVLQDQVVLLDHQEQVVHLVHLVLLDHQEQVVHLDLLDLLDLQV